MIFSVKLGTRRVNLVENVMLRYENKFKYWVGTPLKAAGVDPRTFLVSDL